MKARFENFLIINYCLNNPIKSLLILIVAFTFIISIDQSLIVDQALASTHTSNSANAYTTSYVGWCSTNPEVISYLREIQGQIQTSEEAGYFVSEKTALTNLVFFIETQVKTFQRIVNLIF